MIGFGWIDPSEEKDQFVKFSEVDDGGESNSSSNLFELQNYDLGYCSSGLPVFDSLVRRPCPQGQERMFEARPGPPKSRLVLSFLSTG